MRVEDIEIIADEDLGRPYKVLGPIKARVTSGSAFNKARTVEDVNSKLREVALRMGANAIINARYERGISMTSWKALTAFGTAVVAEETERLCPFCAETIKRAASACRFCGRDVAPLRPLPEPDDRSEEWKSDPSGRHPDRYYDASGWTKWVRDKPGGTRSEDPPWL
jgi:hypothetical protein